MIRRAPTFVLPIAPLREAGLRTAGLRSLACCLAAALALLAAAPAQAVSLDDAKSAGQVGERPDGYLGLVNQDAPEAVKQLVKSVNAKRRASYEGIAAKRGTSVEAVAALAGKKLIERAPPGEYIMDPDGNWKQK
jgi:uncharacterized protein YdbL (DUF1318 family)